MDASLLALLPVLRQAAGLTESVGAALGAGLIQAKGVDDPVTVGDWGCQALICRALAEHFPDDPVVGEENLELLGAQRETLTRVTDYVRAVHPAATDDAVASWIAHGATRETPDRFWTLDPIDGTKGYVRGDQYAIALALVEAGEVTAAFIACPRLPISRAEGDDIGALFWATRGGSAYCQPLLRRPEPHRIAVSELRTPSLARYAESIEAWSANERHAEIAGQLQLTATPVRMDSMAKYALVARGDVELFMRVQRDPNYREKIWDHAAGIGIVEAAGGRVSDFVGRRLILNEGPLMAASGGVLVSNGHLHEPTLDAIRALGGG